MDRVTLGNESQHETLTERFWTGGWAQEALEEIVSDAVAAASPGGQWPVDPRDDPATDDEVSSGLYLGAAGVAWGLPAVRRERGAAVGAVGSGDRPVDPDMYGSVNQYLGPGHGCAADAHALRGSVSDDALAQRVPGLCHGTAGGGYACLRLHALTGDAMWLDRARRFAVHAVEQVRRERHAVSHGRYSLFTGDIGVARYLRACLDVNPAFPVLDDL